MKTLITYFGSTSAEDYQCNKELKFIKSNLKAIRCSTGSFVLIGHFHCCGQSLFVVKYSVIKGQKKFVYDWLALYAGLAELTNTNQVGSQTT